MVFVFSLDVADYIELIGPYGCTIRAHHHALAEMETMPDRAAVSDQAI